MPPRGALSTALQHIYKVLTGQRKHGTADTLAALARVFGVSADYLLGLQDNMAPSVPASTLKKRTRKATPVA